MYGLVKLPVEQINNKEEPTYLHHDQAGSTRLLTSATGAITGTYTYTPYGATETHIGATTTPLGYDAQYTSSDTGLIYLRARAYDPNTGLFMSVDPVVSITRAPYGYAGDNPVNQVDPTGLSSTAEGLGENSIPCFYPFCSPPPPLEEAIQKGVEKVEHGIEGFVHAITESNSDEGEAELKEKEAERENCGNPATPPGSKFEWKAKGPEGSNEGSWWDPENDESLYPHLGENSHGPHYDYYGPSGRYRIYPGGRIEPK